MPKLEIVRPAAGPSLRALAEAPAEVFDAIPAALYLVDAEGHLIRYNQRAVDLWGRLPSVGDNGDRYCGSYRAYTSEGTPLQLADAPMAEVLRSGEAARDREVIIERPDGSRSFLLVNIEPITDSTGRLTGAINCFQDITQRWSDQQELRRSKQDLEDFFENGAVGLHIVGADGIIQRANKAELAMLGYREEEYIGQPISKFHADEAVLCDILSRLTEGESLDKYPARLLAKDGSIRHVLITSNGHFADGEFLHTRCFSVDVTDWHHAELAKGAAERRLQVTHDAAPVGISETDAYGRHLHVNPALSKITGYSREQLLARSFADLTHPEDKAEDLRLYREQVQGTQDNYTIEKRYVRANGTHIFVQVISSAVRDPGGRFLYGVRVVQDITERRLAQDRAAESERRVRDLLDALPVAIYTTDDQGRITFFNQAAVDFSGRQPTLGEDSWCVSWRLYDSEGVAMRHEECPMATTLRTGEEIRGVIAQAERPDGTRVPFMPFPKVLRDATGEVVGAINMLVDMTARKKAEDEQRILSMSSIIG